MDKKKTNKKPLVALLLIAIIGVVGGTFAYFTSTDTFTNLFATKPYIMEVVETFTSPDNWTPGTTTPKTVVATNKGDVDAAVRVSLSEGWVDSNGSTLSLTDSANRSAAIINFASDLSTAWTKITENGTDYYYYNTKLSKGESSSSLIDSVTFNPKVTIASTNECDTTTVAGKQTCTTTTSGYAGGKYTLTITVETVQYDQYKTAWNTTADIK